VARNIQTKHYSSIRNSNDEVSDIVFNAGMRVGEIRQFCRMGDEGHRLMRVAMTQLNLPARADHRILKLSWTIADLADAPHASQPAQLMLS
jgi:predicted ATPase with chaperone activity